MTATTDIPVNGDGTYDEPTWGEGGGPFAVPPFESAGYAGVALPSNDVNYEWQHLARWLRATAITRMVPSDRGLFASFLFTGSGTWLAGVGLNASLTASWVMIDASSDGGVVVQFNVPVGSPHLFTASRDTYVGLNEAGAAEYQEVLNGGLEPVASAGYVTVWKVVTDGAAVTGATVLIPTTPTFRNITALNLSVSGDLDIVGTLVVGSTLEVTGSSTLTGNVSIGGNLDMTSGAISNVTTLATSGNVSIGGALDMTSGAISNVTTLTADAVVISTLSYHSVRGSTEMGSTNTRIYRWTAAVDNSGTDIVYTDDATFGGSWAIAVAGIYTVSMSIDAGHAGYIAIKKAAALSNTFDETAIMVVGESAVGIAMSLSWTGHCAVGDDIWIAASSSTPPTGTPVNNQRCSVTRVR